ncbi:5-methylcytosine rRNA methyltransferase NSUN4 [Culicoides brevitarsis]|uniref:5-methylcytosine rRNA methyltransferase NSUN4 n=1 Tax=Culicoides brevitarsis TaxID=469753 RepID=UPI00307BBE2A
MIRTRTFRILKTQNLSVILRRWKSKKKDHWSNLQNKLYPIDRALDNFDDFYGSVFGQRWKSMRIAMLCERKYIALVNTFGDTEKTIEQMKNNGAINIREIIENTPSDEEFTASNTPLEAKMDRFIEKKEAEDIYKNVEGTSAGKSDENSVDYKQSLDETLKKDTEIQHERLVNKDNVGALYDFIPATQIKGMEDFVFESEHYRYYSNQTDFPLKFTKDTNIHFPDNLHVFTYEQGNTSTYKQPKRGATGAFSHYLMDGASLLPVLALDIQPGDTVLDACAAPGGKSLLMTQTLYPKTLVCNDISESRLNRLRYIMRDFICDFHEKWLGKRIFITQSNAINMNDYETYDKILVDAPCTGDRYAVTINENNYFKPSRVKERIKLPETQAAILENCVRHLKPGGSLVYSTCSLSPVQNDGVVHMALTKLFQDHGITTTIHDLSSMTQRFKLIYKFENPSNLKYGQLVLPYLPNNFGPMYFCKITRNVSNVIS